MSIAYDIQSRLSTQLIDDFLTEFTQFARTNICPEICPSPFLWSVRCFLAVFNTNPPDIRHKWFQKCFIPKLFEIKTRFGHF